MTRLDDLRAAQGDDLTLPSDHALAAFLAACDPDQVQLDRAAHATPIELRMIGHQHRRAS